MTYTATNDQPQAPALELQPDRSTALLDALYENMRRQGRDAALLDAAACVAAGLVFKLSVEGSEAAFYLLARAETELVAAVAREKDAPSGRPH